MIVVVVIALLAGIGIQRFANARRQGYVAAMKSDLRNLVSAEEAFYSDSNGYAAAGDTSRLRFRSSPGVSTPAIVVGDDGWSATVTHLQVPGFACGIAIKALNPVDAAAGNGEPACH